MKKQTNIILIAIVLVLLILTGWALFKRYDSSVESTGNAIKNSQGFDYNDYCELDTEAGTCLPEDKCKFYEDSKGVKWCMGILK